MSGTATGAQMSSGLSPGADECVCDRPGRVAVDSEADAGRLGAHRATNVLNLVPRRTRTGSGAARVGAETIPSVTLNRSPSWFPSASVRSPILPAPNRRTSQAAAAVL